MAWSRSQVMYVCVGMWPATSFSPRNIIPWVSSDVPTQTIILTLSQLAVCLYVLCAESAKQSSTRASNRNVFLWQGRDQTLSLPPTIILPGCSLLMKKRMSQMAESFGKATDPLSAISANGKNFMFKSSQAIFTEWQCGINLIYNQVVSAFHVRFNSNKCGNKTQQLICTGRSSSNKLLFHYENRCSSNIKLSGYILQSNFLKAGARVKNWCEWHPLKQQVKQYCASVHVYINNVQ